jgi:recombinational DNA repair ATPase RecF
VTDRAGFDESFNAITGLNGSGKSNILDAICFVLGITNMQSVSSLDYLPLSKTPADISGPSQQPDGPNLQAVSWIASTVREGIS